ncbi:MAG TPA: 50S ribosomal protein L29 [Candidatus Sumerlaeota bacterium]|nr:50S ribosomal protein L29 [Candidatus Sumerlaeota bacterium]HOR27555.1 50S ribosomal protein L29 [Candidatus Sumerlaeota bacterium]HPK03827.1 50S ribosomal protein L29 [Candidatus Sumerlaeota bacterium]
MQAAEYRKMSIEELEDQVDQLRTELFNLRVKNTTKELQDTSRIRRTRRDLARVLSVLTEKRRPAEARA